MYILKHTTISLVLRVIIFLNLFIDYIEDLFDVFDEFDLFAEFI